MTKFYQSLTRRTKISLIALIVIWIISLLLHHYWKTNEYDNLLWYAIGLVMGWNTSSSRKDEDNEEEEEEEYEEEGDE